MERPLLHMCCILRIYLIYTVLIGDVAMTRDRRRKFVELAEKRTNRAINDIRLVGNLANRSNYEYSEADSKAIVRAIEEELRALKAKFEQSSRGDKEFKL